MFLSLGFNACGDKSIAIDDQEDASTDSSPSNSSGASGSTSTQSTATGSVSPSSMVNPSTSKPPEDGGSGADTSTLADAQSTASECGGPGQECCAGASCDDGFVCIYESPNSDNDGGLVVFDAGRNNQAIFDGGGFDFPDSSFQAIDAGISDTDDVPEGPAGVCAPCGGEDERCCAASTCHEGLSCDSKGFGPNAELSCVALPGEDGAASPQDSGQSTDEPDAAAECGGLEQACCPGRRGQCDDGLECDVRPPAGLEGNVCIED